MLPHLVPDSAQVQELVPSCGPGARFGTSGLAMGRRDYAGRPLPTDRQDPMLGDELQPDPSASAPSIAGVGLGDWRDAAQRRHLMAVTAPGSIGRGLRVRQLPHPRVNRRCHVQLCKDLACSWHLARPGPVAVQSGL